MKLYLLFAYYDFEASGGWRDFKGAYPTILDCYNAANDIAPRADQFHIVDTVTMKIVQEGECSGGLMAWEDIK